MGVPRISVAIWTGAATTSICPSAARANARVRPYPVQRAPPSLEIDRPSIVGIDQRQVPQLVALIDVGHARGSELEDRLRQGIEDAEGGNLLLELVQIVQECAALAPVENRARELQDGLLIFGIGRDPAGVNLGLLERLEHEFADA